MRPPYTEVDEILMIPGPTPLHPEVVTAMGAPMMNHRGPSFAKLHAELVAGLQYAFQTKNEMFIFPSSGTGGMEAAVVNVLSPGDKVLCVNIGAFGARFVNIATVYGADVQEMRVERGKAADVSAVRAILEADKNREIKAVLFQQNETSTGVLNPVRELAEAIDAHGALKIVDAVSGLLAAPLDVDAWGLDVVVSGSQKGFMVPPGLSFVSVSKKAWEVCQTAKMPRFYWDFRLAKKFADNGQTPVTPALSLYYGMQRSLAILQEGGLAVSFARHAGMKAACRKGLQAMGLTLLAEEQAASPAVTAVLPPEGVQAEEVRKKIRTEHNIVLAGGQEELKGKIFRMGHLGYVGEEDILATFTALEKVFSELGYRWPASGVDAARATFRAAQVSLAT